MVTPGCVPWTHECAQPGASNQETGQVCPQPHKVASNAALSSIQRSAGARSFLQGKTSLPHPESTKHSRALGNKSCVCLNRTAITKMKRNGGQI